MEATGKESKLKPKVMLVTGVDGSMRYVSSNNRRYMVWGATSPKSKGYLEHYQRSEEIVEAHRYIMEGLLDSHKVDDEFEDDELEDPLDFDEIDKEPDFFDVIGEVGWLANAVELPTSWFIEKAKPGSTPLCDDPFYSEARRIGERERIRNSAVQKKLITAGEVSEKCYKPNLLMMETMDSQRFLRIFSLVALLVKQNKELAGKIWKSIPPPIRTRIKELRTRGGRSFNKLQKKRETTLVPSENFINYLKSIGFSNGDLAELIKEPAEIEINEQDIAWENMAYIFFQIAYTIERALAGWIKYGFASEAKFDEITAVVVEALCPLIGDDTGDSEGDVMFNKIIDEFCKNEDGTINQNLCDDIFSPLFELVTEINKEFSNGEIRSKMIRFGEKADREGKYPPPEGISTPYKDFSEGETVSFPVLALSPSEPLKGINDLAAHVTRVMKEVFPLCEEQFHSIQMDPFLRREESWQWTQEEAIQYLKQFSTKEGNLTLAKKALTRMDALVMQIDRFASANQFYSQVSQLDEKGILYAFSRGQSPWRNIGSLEAVVNGMKPIGLEELIKIKASGGFRMMEHDFFPLRRKMQLRLSDRGLKDSSLAEIESIRIRELLKIMIHPYREMVEINFPFKEAYEMNCLRKNCSWGSELDFPSKEGICSEMKRLRAMELLMEMADALNHIPPLRDALEDSGVMGALRREYSISDITKFDRTDSDIEPLSLFAQRVAQITHLRDKLEELMKHTKYNQEINRWGVEYTDPHGKVGNKLREALNKKIERTREDLLDMICAAEKDEIGQEEYGGAKTPKRGLVVGRMESILAKLTSQNPELREDLEYLSQLYSTQKDKIRQKKYLRVKTPEEDLIDRMERALDLSKYPELGDSLRDFLSRLKACLRLDEINTNPVPNSPPPVYDRYDFMAPFI